LCRRIGWRDELRLDLARRAKGCVVEGCQILLYGAACGLRITRLLPCRTWYRTLLVGVRQDQAGIDGKAFTADQPRRNAVFNDPLEDMTEDGAVPEPLIASTVALFLIETWERKYKRALPKKI
jgi:hypothetical protein